MKDLFLLGSSLLLSSLPPLVALALVAGIGAGNTESTEDRLLLLGSLDLALGNGAVGRDRVDLGEGSLGSLLDLLSGSVALLRGLGVTREDDSLRAVLLQAGNVGLESLDVTVLAAVVDGDTDGGGELAGDTGKLYRSQRAPVELVDLYS